MNYSTTIYNLLKIKYLKKNSMLEHSRYVLLYIYFNNK